MDTDILKLLDAIEFAAEKHKFQRRKGDDNKIPYINHPIQVARIIAHYSGTKDVNVLIAAILHDTIEDTQTTPEEIKDKFGDEVLAIVLEVTDDRNLPKSERKNLQVLNAHKKSNMAKLVKLADKICNVKDIGNAPPTGWSEERIIEYIDWAESVILGLRGANAALEAKFDEIVAKSRLHYKSLKETKTGN